MAQTFQIDLKDLITQDAILVDFREEVLIMSCGEEITVVDITLLTKEEYEALKVGNE